MAGLSRQRVLEILGEVDDHTIARIIATGASDSELREAVLEVERSEREGERVSGSSAHSAVVERLHAILARIAADEDASQENAYD